MGIPTLEPEAKPPIRQAARRALPWKWICFLIVPLIPLVYGVTVFLFAESRSSTPARHASYLSLLGGGTESIHIIGLTARVPVEAGNIRLGTTAIELDDEMAIAALDRAMANAQRSGPFEEGMWYHGNLCFRLSNGRDYCPRFAVVTREPKIFVSDPDTEHSIVAQLTGDEIIYREGFSIDLTEIENQPLLDFMHELISRYVREGKATMSDIDDNAKASRSAH